MTCPAYCCGACSLPEAVQCLVDAGRTENEAIAEAERWAPAHQTDSGPGGAITPPGLTRTDRRP